MKIKDIFSDLDFYKKMIMIALPIALQNLIISSINMADVFMIGQLGESEIAGVGIANQIFFLFILLLFGTNSGTGIFIAQYWGKKDIKNIHKVLGLALIVSLFISIVFFVASIFIPDFLISIYTKDKTVIEIGSSYLVFVSLSFPFAAISFTYSLALRSIAKTMLPMYVSMVTFVVNIALDYVLIFGKFGFPQMGVEGAALATVIARAGEAIVMVISVYTLKNYVVLAAKFKNLININGAFVARIMGISFPVIINEGVWSLGITTQNIIYARISTESIASINIAGSIDRIAFVSFIGLASATAVMIGNKIGEQKEELAYLYSIRFSILAIGVALLTSLFVFLGAKPIIGLFNISEIVSNFSYYLIIVILIMLPFRAFNTINIVGSLRAGGDTKYCLVLDLGALWLFSIPLAGIGAFFFGFPVYIVYILASSEEFIKFVLTFRRIKSKKWIKNLVKD